MFDPGWQETPEPCRQSLKLEQPTRSERNREMSIKTHGQGALADDVAAYEYLERCILVSIELHHLRVPDEMCHLAKGNKEVHQVHVLRYSTRG